MQFLIGGVVAAALWLLYLIARRGQGQQDGQSPLAPFFVFSDTPPPTRAPEASGFDAAPVMQPAPPPPPVLPPTAIPAVRQEAINRSAEGRGFSGDSSPFVQSAGTSGLAALPAPRVTSTPPPPPPLVVRDSMGVTTYTPSYKTPSNPTAPPPPPLPPAPTAPMPRATTLAAALPTAGLQSAVKAGGLSAFLPKGTTGATSTPAPSTYTPVPLKPPAPVLSAKTVTKVGSGFGF